MHYQVSKSSRIGRGLFWMLKQHPSAVFMKNIFLPYDSEFTGVNTLLAFFKKRREAMIFKKQGYFYIENLTLMYFNIIIYRSKMYKLYVVTFLC